MKTESEALEIRSSVQATRGDGERLFLRHDKLTLSFKSGKLRLAGAKRPSVFRVPLRDVTQIHWRQCGWQVDFVVEGQNYHIAFWGPEWEQLGKKMWPWSILRAPGVLIIGVLLWRRRQEITRWNCREADKWRAILKESNGNDPEFSVPT